MLPTEVPPTVAVFAPSNVHRLLLPPLAQSPDVSTATASSLSRRSLSSNPSAPSSLSIRPNSLLRDSGSSKFLRWRTVVKGRRRC